MMHAACGREELRDSGDGVNGHVAEVLDGGPEGEGEADGSVWCLCQLPARRGMDGAGVRYRKLDGAVHGHALLWRVCCRAGYRDDRTAAGGIALLAEDADVKFDEIEDGTEVNVDDGVARLFEGGRRSRRWCCLARQR